MVVDIWYYLLPILWVSYVSSIVALADLVFICHCLLEIRFLGFVFILLDYSWTCLSGVFVLLHAYVDYCYYLEFCSLFIVEGRTFPVCILLSDSIGV